MNRSGPTAAVLPLSDPLSVDLAYAGGKGANLARLLQEGFRVPEGICVTTGVFDHLVAENATSALIDDLDDVDSGSSIEQQAINAEMREHIRTWDIPDDVISAIREFVDRDSRYVVRSSASAEDLPTASFAGQYETVLDISDLDGVLDAVTECMASLFTDRAVSYRTNNGISHTDVSMAVIVQRMVDAEVSGVLFTADPLSGNRNIASIEAASGLGEAVVSGTVTADTIRMHRTTKEMLEYRVGNTGEGSRILEDEQVVALVEYGESIERLFGSPQDIEWSIEGKQVWILQSRPITALFPIPTPAPTDSDMHVYYSYNHRQGMTDPMPPLSVDFVRQYASWTLGKLFGYEPSGFDPMVGAGGRVYIDVTPMLRSDRLRKKWLDGIAQLDKPGAALQRTVFDERGTELSATSAIGEQSLKAYGRIVWKLVRTGSVAGVRTLQGVLKRDYEEFPDQTRAYYESYVDERIGVIRAGETESERLRRAFDETCAFGWAANVQFMTGAGFIAKLILRRWCPDAEDEFEALDKGLRDNVTISMVMELGDLADLARKHPEVLDIIRSGGTWEELREANDSEQFLEEFEHFLDEYGHRASSELDPSKPRYREDPSPLLNTIQMKVAGDTPGEHREHLNRMEAEAEAAIRELERRASGGIFGSVRRTLVRPLAARYRSFKATRETPKYAYARLWEEFRIHVLEAGNRLAREGKIESREAVWFFNLDELLYVLEHPGDPIDIDLATRRSDYLAHRALQAPRVMTSDGEIPRLASSKEDGDAKFFGVATSNGVAEGEARVVYDPRTDRLEEGEILVCPYTDPGWTPLFLNAAGLVTNVGGVFSHGSLVAREYGIPSVVVDSATENITTGQRIRVDGNAGVVEVVDEDA